MMGSLTFLIGALLLLLFFFFFLPFLGPLPRHMEVSRPGVESELQPPPTHATATAIRGSELHQQPTPQPMATPDPNPPSKARDRTPNLMVPSWIRLH